MGLNLFLWLSSLSLRVEGYKTDFYSKLRARIPLFRNEVKERCNTITQAEFLPMATVGHIVRSVEWQCSNYHYTFPTGPMASDSYYLVVTF
jgi:hypothetical protein